jgi:phenylpropionate dioxygenase-like ring-hydroxylating dioxygenase large terminal subunit
MPSGWFQIGWSAEFTPGHPLPLRYFEQALVAFRGEGGELHVLDAYCPHMGADLGFGGRVRGDDIVCPYHGWEWSGRDGSNTVIPYGDKERMNLSLECWPVREIDGVALVWYSPSRTAPRFEPPARFYRTDADARSPYPDATAVWRDVNLVPQFAAENVPDAAHFTHIHRATRNPTLEAFEASEGTFRAHWTLIFGEDRPPTWATPTGPVEGRILTETHGVGLGWNTQFAFDEITSLSGYTPVDRFTSDVRLTVWAPKRRGDGSVLDDALATRWFEFQKGQLESDMVVWSHQTYVERPPFASPETAAMRALRDWSRQFYERDGSATEVRLRTAAAH